MSVKKIGLQLIYVYIKRRYGYGSRDNKTN